MLITCEGTKTEYNYFNWLAENIAIPNQIWSKVEVCNEVSLPDDFPKPQKTELHNRPKRQFANPNKRQAQEEENALKILLQQQYGETEGERLYKAQKAVPVRYVALAQVYDAYFDEIWAVFDKDGHSHHKQAFELAKKHNPRPINIAFSSRSFEQWILLHFETANKPFNKTACKDKNGKELGCNNENRCAGDECLCGYLRRNHLPNYGKNAIYDSMSILQEKQKNAFENAEKLRKKAQRSPIYEQNPYSDVDILVKMLIGN